MKKRIVMGNSLMDYKELNHEYTDDSYEELPEEQEDL